VLRVKAPWAKACRPSAPAQRARAAPALALRGAARARRPAIWSPERAAAPSLPKSKWRWLKVMAARLAAGPQPPDR